jgi:hypothetical protein
VGEELVWSVADVESELILQAVQGVLACAIIGGISGLAMLKLLKPGESNEPTR